MMVGTLHSVNGISIAATTRATLCGTFQTGEKLYIAGSSHLSMADIPHRRLYEIPTRQLQKLRFNNRGTRISD